MASHGGGGGRIRTILLMVFIVLVLGLLIYWIVTGGLQRAWAVGKSFSNPIAVIFNQGTTTGTYITLPWQPEQTRGPDISDYVTLADSQQQSAEAQWQDSSTNPPSKVAQYGEPSPYAGMISISGNNATDADPALEYIAIRASSGNSSPINVSGWILQSAVSGIYGVLPQAATVFIGGVVNSVGPVALAPGAGAVITTGASPVGVSFGENTCTGYLSQLQQFYPNLAERCPAPSDVLPQTAQTLRTYGASCFDYLNGLPACYFPGTSLPAGLSSACRSFLSNNLSYNGCVAMYRGQADFLLSSWRLYLTFTRELWNNSHDVIRLLDGQGRVVDVLSY